MTRTGLQPFAVDEQVPDDEGRDHQPPTGVAAPCPPKTPKARKVRPLPDGPARGPGTSWEHKARDVEALGTAIEVDHLVYCAPCDTSTTPVSKRYDARRGQAPGFAELRAKLEARGITLVVESPFYWRAVAVGAT